MADQKRPREDDLPKFEDPTDLINAVISTLQSPEEKTYVSANYANDKNLATEVQAYAKIAGCNWTFYVKSLAISIGRNTDNVPGTLPPQQTVDIDLGPAKVVSRQHAAIIYNIDLRCWELKVLGRNGARVDGAKIAVGSQHATPLHSGAILDIGGTQMMFILPDAPPSILQKMLNICLSRYKRESSKTLMGSSISDNSVLGNSNSLGMGQFSSISNFHMFDKSNLSHSPSAASAVSLQNNLDQDLSREDAKDIKPPYSYATMITQAILSNPEGVMSLSEIYGWISSHYAYYKYSKTGWQNSIRHNLSLNKAFEKVPRRPNEPGKGMKWQISDSYKQDFMKKIQSGTLLKSRRGSSVSRTLQIHLATHSQLPDSQQYFKPEPHSRSGSFDLLSMQIDPHSNSGQKQSQPMPYVGMPHVQPHHPGSNGYPVSYGTPYQQSGVPPLMHGHQSQQLHLNPPYVPNQSDKPTELASPLRQSTRLEQNLPKLPKVNGGNHYFSLPQPTPNGASHLGGNNAVPEINIYKINAQTSQDNSEGSAGDNGGPGSFSNTSMPPNTSESMQNSTALTATSASDLGLAFTSPKKIAPLEAFTPERGSKASGQGSRGAFNGNANQSSPALWNFVQFSTPNGQTPGRKDSEFSNGQTSPTFSKGANSKKRQLQENDSPTNISPIHEPLSK